MSDSHLQEAAMAYAHRGWPVFPLWGIKKGPCTCGKAECSSPGKHPRTLHGVKDATTDVSHIEDWWNQWPDANIGMATGQGSGIIVLDVDAPHGGEQTLSELVTQFGPLPRTYEQATGNGRHLLFAIPDGSPPIRSNAGRLGPGLDVRAEGGYVVLAPSQHANGVEYQWTQYDLTGVVEPAVLPLWVVDLLKEAPPSNPVLTSAIEEKIPQGKRHRTLISLGGTMRQRGMSAPAIESALQTDNCERCDPPLPDAEVDSIAKSAAHYTPEATNQDSSSFHPISADQLADKVFIERKELVPGLLVTGVHLLVGKPKLGKSWLALQIALSVALGESVFGISVNDWCEVLFVGLEDSERRLQQRLAILTDTSPRGLFLHTTLKRFYDGGLAQLEKWLTQHPACGLVIVDTLGRARSQGKRVGNLYLEDTQLGADLQALAVRHDIAMLVVHHLNKLKSRDADDVLDRVSGTLGLVGSVDSVWLLNRQREGTNGTLLVTGRDIEEQSFNLEFDQTACRWELDGPKLVVLHPARRGILDHLKSHGPLAPCDIAKLTGQTQGGARQLLYKMIRDKQVIKTGDEDKYDIPHNNNNAVTP